jgi:murein DD-endopeptidase MepM/ murein hydrolase activator NlpD
MINWITRSFEKKYFQSGWLLLAVFLVVFSDAPGRARAEQWNLSLRDTRLFPGGVARVNLAPAKAVSSASLSWKGASIPLVPLAEKGRLSAFFGIPRDEAPGEKAIEIVVTGQDGTEARFSRFLSVEPKDYPVQRITLPESKVSLDEASLARHRREQKDVTEALAGLRRDPLWQEGFVRPVPGEVISPFGLQRILNDKPRSPHSGLDLRTPMGQPVVASAAGVVVLAADHFFSGKAVYIDHGMGIVTMYFHLSEIKVRPGERVMSGQTIGLAGSTGRSTGPHLHWGVKVHDCNVDPLALLDVVKTETRGDGSGD